MRRSVMFLVLAMMLSASSAFAQLTTPAALNNWPQWRGPEMTGVAPKGNPPTEWSEEKNVKWKIEVPGDSTATPIVWGDKVFVTSAIKTDREGEPAPPPAEFAATSAEPAKGKRGFRTSGEAPKNIFEFVTLCYDRATGKEIWRHVANEAVPHEGHHPDGSYSSASPSTDGQRLYVSFGSFGVYCYDLEGKLLWKRDLGRMWTFNSFGEGASPVIYGDNVIVNWDHQGGSFLICLDAATGETRWKIDREETTTWATPLVLDAAGHVQVILHGSTRVRSYDLATGELIWACGGQGPSAIPTPVSDGTRVFAMTGFITNTLYAIPLNSTGDITEDETKVAWKSRKIGTPYVPSPLLVGDLLYFTAGNKGILSCYNAATGEPVVEKQRLEGIANIYASPVEAAGHIYVTSREGNTVVFETGKFDESGDKKEVKLLFTNTLDDRFDASAAIVGPEIFLRGRKHLYCIAAP